MEKFLPFIEGDIKIKSLKKFYSMRFIIRRYLRINFFGNVKKNKTVKIYDSVKRLQTNRFLKYCSKLRRYLIPALISMQLAQNAKMALNLVKHGYVFVNGHKITKINFIIKPLDLIMLFIPHSSHPYYLQNHHYFAKNLNSNIARVNTMQRPTNFVNGAIFPSRFFLINLKLEDWFKFMHF
jgi:ribosomal protein S4